MRLSLRAWLIALTAAVCFAATSWSTTSAQADVAKIDVLPLVPGGAYGTGCTYLLVATTTGSSASGRMPVSFFDLSQGSYIFPQDEFTARKQIYVSPVVGGRAVALWTPTRPGKHTLMAYQTSAGGPKRTVTVRPGTPIGPGCLVR